jgi:hypothetical protein
MYEFLPEKRWLHFCPRHDCESCPYSVIHYEGIGAIAEGDTLVLYSDGTAELIKQEAQHGKD